MKKLLALVMILGISALGCGTTDETTEYSPEDLKPPLGLTAIAGDGQVTLTWDSANSLEDDNVPSSFTVYMAVGDNSAIGEGASQSKENEELAIFDSSAERDGLNPILVVPVESIPGKVSVTIKDGDAIDLSSLEVVEEEAADDDDDDAADDDDEAADDDDDDAAAEEKLMAAQTTDATDTTDDDDDDAADTTEGVVTLANGQTVTFFVTVRVDDNEGESFTSNLVAVTPRPEAKDIAVDVLAGDCLDVSGMAVVAYDATDASYTDSCDLLFSGFSCTGARPRTLVVANDLGTTDVADDAMVQDFGGVITSWDEAAVAPSDGYLAVGQKTVVAAGHVFMVYTRNGEYGKVFISANTACDTLTADIAVQDAGADRPTDL